MRCILLAAALAIGGCMTSATESSSAPPVPEMTDTTGPTAGETPNAADTEMPKVLTIRTGPECPGSMVFTEMEGPTPTNESLECHQPWVSCIAEATRGASGENIAEHVTKALEKCGTTVPGIGLATAGTGLFAGKRCATTRTTDVYFYVTVGGSRLLRWNGWHTWQCDEPK